MFTDDAVFIDTAGRYVTQDSDARVDRAAWQTFLEMIARNRPAEPLNGVIVAVSVEDIATGDAAELEAHAAAVRRGLHEIYEKMRARVPVYVMLTKADLLIGFDEFFQALPKGEREQVWGVTFPYAGGDDPRQRADNNLAQLESEFDLLLERLAEKQFPRVQEEQDLGIRSRIFGFPSQFSSLTPVVARFLRTTFAPDRYSEPILLRGIYFTSATQVGQPIDRLIASMSREFGLDRRATGVLTPRSGRAYFLRGLLEQVIFPEAGLVSLQGRRRGIVSAGRYAALAACVAVPVLLGLGWWNVHAFMREQTEPFVSALAEYQFSLDMLGPDATEVSDGDLARVIPPLDRLRAERERLAEASPPLGGLGVDDIEGLRAQADAAYMKALDDLFRPRLLFQLQGWMDKHADDPAGLYNALKAYLIVGGRAPELSPAEVGFATSVLEDEWEANQRYDPVVQRELLETFRLHLSAMFEGMESGAIRERSLNDGQIASARAKARDLSPAQRAYGILMSHPEVRELPDWTIPQRVGAAAGQVLVRASGKDLSDPIPGIFTFEGFWTVFAPNANPVVEEALAEKWVLNREPGSTEVTSQEQAAAAREIRRIYHDDYTARWNGLLNDIRVIPFQDAAHAAEVLRILSAGGSPLRDLLHEVVRQTNLTDRPGEDAEIWSKMRPLQLSRMGRAGAALSRLNYQTGGIAGDMAAGSISPPAPAQGEGEPTARAFADLREFVGSADEGSALEQMLQRLRALRTVVSDMAARRTGDLSALASDDAAIQLAREAELAPEPIQRMVDEMLQTFNTAVADGLKGELNRIWRSTVAPQCASLIAGKYPFGSGTEVPIGDFAAVLGPDGPIDRFFKTHLESMVDTNQVEWRWKGLGLSLGIPANRLDFFRTAAEIRDAFFPHGGQRPEVRFGVFPIAMDPEVVSTRLMVGGSEAAFEQGEKGSAQFYWPGAAPENGAEATLTIKTGATDISGAPMPPVDESVIESGPWGLFKLIDRSELRTLGNGAVVHVGIRAADRRVVLGFRMDSARNPFAMHRKIRAFRCPSEL